MIIRSNAAKFLVVSFTFSLYNSLLAAAEPSFPITDISLSEQYAMIENYCASCHLDTAMNGGLSLEHFDAATASPSLATILVSKFTTGVPLEDIVKSELDSQIIEEIELGKRLIRDSLNPNTKMATVITNFRTLRSMTSEGNTFFHRSYESWLHF